MSNEKSQVARVLLVLSLIFGIINIGHWWYLLPAGAANPASTLESWAIWMFILQIFLYGSIAIFTMTED